MVGKCCGKTCRCQYYKWGSLKTLIHYTCFSFICIASSFSEHIANDFLRKISRNSDEAPNTPNIEPLSYPKKSGFFQKRRLHPSRLNVSCTWSAYPVFGWLPLLASYSATSCVAGPSEKIQLGDGFFEGLKCYWTQEASWWNCLWLSLYAVTGWEVNVGGLAVYRRKTRISKRSWFTNVPIKPPSSTTNQWLTTFVYIQIVYIIYK